MKPTNADIDNAIDAIERHERWSKPTLIELVAPAYQISRLPPLQSMEWTGAEKVRLRAYLKQATRFRRVSLAGRLLGWLR